MLDGDGAPVPDAVIEVWQANEAGRYNHPDDRRDDAPLDPGFRGFGRVATDADGGFRLVTIKPGPVPGRGNAWQAPHINVALFARGLLRHLYTRIYFADDPRNAADPLLSSIEDENGARHLAGPAGGRRRAAGLALRYRAAGRERDARFSIFERGRTGGGSRFADPPYPVYPTGSSAGALLDGLGRNRLRGLAPTPARHAEPGQRGAEQGQRAGFGNQGADVILVNACVKGELVIVGFVNRP